MQVDDASAASDENQPVDDASADVEISEAEKRAAKRAIGLRVLPALFLIALFCYFDRANLSFAAIDMNRELNFTSSVYGTGAGIFFAGYSGFTIPCSILLKRLGPVRGLSLILVGWGIFSGIQAAIMSAGSMYIMRFLLGISESAFFPVMMFYVASWYTRADIGLAMTIVDMATAVSGLVGGPLAGGIIGLTDGAAGLSGWRWLFIIEAVPSVLMGICVLWLLPKSLQDAKFLTQKQRSWMMDLHRDEHERRSHGISTTGGWRQTLRVVLSFRVLILSFMWTFWAAGYYGIIYWIPLIVKNSLNDSSSAFTVGLFTAIPFAAAIVSMLIVGWNSDRMQERRYHFMALSGLGGIGLILTGILMLTTDNNLGLLLFALTLAAVGIWSVFGPFWSIPTSMLAGDAAAVGLAVIIAVGNIGGFIGPYIIGAIKEATGGYGGALVLLGIVLGICSLCALLLPLPTAVCGCVVRCCWEDAAGVGLAKDETRLLELDEMGGKEHHDQQPLPDV